MRIANKALKLGQSGQSLVQVLVSVGIMGIVMMGFVSMLTTQQAETRALGEKFAAMDLERILAASLVNGSTCKYILNNPLVLTFDSTAVKAGVLATLTPNLPLYTEVLAGVPGSIVAEIGKPASVYSNSLIVNSIKLKIISGVGTSFLGHWEIGFDSTKTVRPLKPITIATLITADISTPAAAKVTDCMGGAGSVNFNTCRVVKNSGVTNGVNGITAMCSANEVIISGTCVFTSVQNSYYVDSAGKNINMDNTANPNDPKGYGCGWNPGVGTWVSAMCCKKN